MEEEIKDIQNNAIGINVGTYDGSILGLSGPLDNLESIYSFNITAGPIKSMQICRKYLFVGGYDEVIRIYDINKYKQIGILEGHQGQILQIKGYKNFLLTCAEDGNILVWKIKEWALLHTLKGHKASVLDLTIHSSGKILLSISKKNKLFIWNLMNTQIVYKKQFKYNIYRILLTDDDNYICLQSDKSIVIIDSSTNEEIKKLEHKKQINDFLIYKQYIIVGDETGKIFIWDAKLKEKNKIETPLYLSFNAHNSRIKKLQVLNLNKLDIIISISSDGSIKIWDCLYIIQNIIEIIECQHLNDQIKPINEIKTKQRLTVMISNVKQQQNFKEQQTNIDQVELSQPEQNQELQNSQDDLKEINIRRLKSKKISNSQINKQSNTKKVQIQEENTIVINKKSKKIKKNECIKPNSNNKTNQ